MNKERRSEAIWIEQRGRWQVNVQLDGKRKTFCSSTPGRKGKHEAEAKADDWLDANAPDDMRFDAAYEEFLKHRKGISRSSYDSANSIGKNWFLNDEKSNKLSCKKLSKVTRNDIQDIVDLAAQEGKSRRTCKNIRDMAAMFFNYAEERGWAHISLKKIKILPSAKASTRTAIQPDKVKILFTDDTIIKYGKPAHFFYIYACRFLVAMGYRRGELCGLKKEDYDGVSLTVRRSINCYNEETQGKNDNARRVNVLPKIARDILKEQENMLKEKGIISPWLFPNEDGNRLDPNSLYKHWMKYADQHGIKENIQEMRHTFISITKTEMPEELLKSVVGHSVKMDTTGIYGHIIDGEKQLAADFIDSAFSKILS